MSDRVLVEGLREGNEDAVDEFICRFDALADRYARWLQVPRDERSHWAGEVLYDVALTLGRGGSAIPRHLAAYIAGACKLKARRTRLASAGYASRVREAAVDAAGTGEYVAMELCSENSLRLTRGPDWEPQPLAPVLEQLASALDEGISAEERQLLSWLGQHVSYTVVARWLGISRPAAVSRIQRLRARLLEVALRFGSSLRAEELVEFVRFLRRTGAVRDDRIIALEHSHTTVEHRDKESSHDEP